MMDNKTSKKEDWIIAVANTEADGAVLYRFNGTEDQTKKMLVRLIKEDRSNDRERFDCGTLTSKEIDLQFGKKLYGYAVYSDYHIDYTAEKTGAIHAL